MSGGGLKAVFLSYASEDSEAAARIAKALSSAGIEVWFDKSELRGGDAWDHKIRQQIQDCSLFIPLVSRSTEARLEGYFRREWHLAADRMLDMAEAKAFLLPVVIDDTRERGAQAPDSFRRVQWTRLPAGESSPAFVARVATLLDSTVSSSTAFEFSRAEQTKIIGTAVKSRWPSRAMAGAIAAVVVIVATGSWHVARRYSPRATTTAVAASEKSIAVLPFADMSEKHDQEYFSDGMAEELIDRLTQIPELRVISRTSAFQFKGKNEDLHAIGQRLSVANVLEGSVRRAADRLRVDVKLVSISDGSQRWSQRYDRPVTDVLRIQDDIANEVVLALKARLMESSEPSGVQIQSDAAHNLLLEGRFLMERWEPGDAERAISKYQQALTEDPNYAPAWVELAWAQMWTTPHQNYAGCASAARRAVEARPESASAHATRGWCESLLGYDWALGAAEFDKALALEPNNIRALYGKGRLARSLGRIDDSLRYYQTVLARDPINPFVIAGYVTTLIAASRPGEAVQQARKMLELSPNAAWGHWYLAYALLWNKELDEALRQSALEPNPSMRLSCQALIARAQGDRQAEEIAMRALLASDNAIKPFFVAEVYAARGDAGTAIAWLERARLARVGWFSEFPADPAFDSIRRDSTFVEYIHRVRLRD